MDASKGSSIIHSFFTIGVMIALTVSSSLFIYASYRFLVLLTAVFEISLIN